MATILQFRNSKRAPLPGDAGYRRLHGADLSAMVRDAMTFKPAPAPDRLPDASIWSLPIVRDIIDLSTVDARGVGI